MWNKTGVGKQMRWLNLTPLSQAKTKDRGEILLRHIHNEKKGKAK